MSHIASGVWSEWVAAYASCHSLPALGTAPSSPRCWSCWNVSIPVHEWVLSVFQVKAWMIQCERQAGMAIPYRKFVINRESILEAKMVAYHLIFFNKGRRPNPPHFDNRKCVTFSLCGLWKNYYSWSLPTRFNFYFFNVSLFGTKKFLLVWSFANFSYHCFCQPPCIKKFLAFKHDRDLQGKDCLWINSKDIPEAFFPLSTLPLVDSAFIAFGMFKNNPCMKVHFPNLKPTES